MQNKWYERKKNAYMYYMDNKIIYFCNAYDKSGKKEAFYRKTLRDRKKVLPFQEAELANPGSAEEDVKIVCFQVPCYSYKEKEWTEQNLRRLLLKSLEQYEEQTECAKDDGNTLQLPDTGRYGQKCILFQPELLTTLKREGEQGAINEAVSRLGKYLFSKMHPREFTRVCLILPGDDFFRLEEGLYWLKDALSPYFGYVKELSMYLMRSQDGVPPVLSEFQEYLELDYGIVGDLWDMNAWNMKDILRHNGLKFGITPYVTVDLDGRSSLPGIICPAGSRYVDMTSSGSMKDYLQKGHPDIRYISPCSVLDTAIKNG